MDKRLPPVLILDPSEEITFEGPFVTTIKSILKISNENEQSVGFAIKTTAPRIFMVSPNSSVIQPRQAITVEISVVPMDKSTLAISHGFKLMVLSAFVDDTLNKEIISETIRRMPKDQVKSFKLRTSFIEDGKGVVLQQPATEKIKPSLQDAASLKLSDYEKREVEHLQQIHKLEEENISLKTDMKSKLVEHEEKYKKHQLHIDKLEEDNSFLKGEIERKDKEKEDMKRNFEAEKQQWEVKLSDVIETGNSNPIQLQLQSQVAHLSVENMKLKGQVRQLQDQTRAIENSWKISHSEILLSNSELGRGGWGVIWVGEFRGQRVAVKQMHELLRSKEYMELLHREINTMSQLRHPNLLQFIGAVLDHPSGNPMIITEVMDTSLRKAYENNELTPDPSCRPVILSIMRDVAVGLNYLHCLPDPIIHRDVSSANVLLESKGDMKWKTKISDFGSAKLARAAVTELPGTIVYSAPESLQSVLDSEEAVQSPLMDSFSFGILLCEVLTCRYPDRRIFRDMLQSIRNLDEGLYDLVACCMEREPSKRPVMKEIILAIENMINKHE